MIDFEIPRGTAVLRDEIRAFVIDKVVPYETDPRVTQHGPTDGLRAELVELTREAGLLTFQAPRAYGGLEPSLVDQAVLYEAAGIGVSDETPVAMIFRDMRAFRLYDGPTEVHKHAIARHVLREQGVSA